MSNSAGASRAGSPEQGMALNHARTSSVIGQVADMVVITDTRGHIEYVNSSFENITGFSRDEVIGANLHILRSEPAEQDENFFQNMRAALKEKGVWRGRMVSRKKDGTLIQEEVCISPLRDPEGNVFNYVTVRRDITQELALQTQLSQAARLEAVGMLASGIAHEINTPTQYVGDNTRFLQDAFDQIMQLLNKYDRFYDAVREKGLADTLGSEVESARQATDVAFFAEEVPQAIQQTLEGVQRITKIVQAMREFSHPGGAEKTPVNLNEAIEHTVTLSRNAWKYVADLETDLDPELPHVRCFPNEINQVFLNIIVNAAQAIEETTGKDPSEKARITVSTRADGTWVEVRIADTGPGIPEDIQEKIFNPFFTTKEVGKGTGQGLAISHAVVVEKHEGELRVESKPGEGALFIIRLPAGDEEEYEPKGEP